MAIVICTIIIIALFVPACVMALTHNMHMFQQNGYKNGEHMSWLKRTLKRQWLLIFAGVLGLLRMIPGYIYCVQTLEYPIASTPIRALTLILDIFCIITLILCYYVFRAMNRLNNKKKLVYTARVKRMIATEIIVMVVLALLSAVFIPLECFAGTVMILMCLQWILPVMANIINHPIEKAGHDKFINSAKKKLAEAENLTIIGVTGSYGKTSVKFYLKTLLSEHFNVLVTPESYNTPLGVVKTINEQLLSTHEIFVCEMGARHVGDIKEICDIVHPHHGVITSIGPQHLETFFSMENIQSTKFELADALPEGGMLFLNWDNEYIRDKAGEYSDGKKKILRFAQDNSGGGTYHAEDIRVSQLGTEFTVVTPDGDSESYQMRLVGEHNVINVLGAIAVAHQMGINLYDLRIPVRRLMPVEHRMQLREHGEVTIIDDAYNSNPVGSKAAVETLKLFDGIRILITPGMVELGDKEEEYNYKFGTYAADCCDYIILVGRDLVKPIEKGVLDSGFDKDRLWTFDNLQDAMAQANAIRGEGHKYILLENDLTDNYN
ncbi:MAG: UDP-N-acetylmuramoyl-tripeptide--D-alanyl-D-alanine ligase [Lachnospiraceae bacterium]|nr:UDP-N-acetylmuramoyl-tripeptide--D-alanyl-D-alanine ligase [Lachnospiraceae bacterium]